MVGGGSQFGSGVLIIWELEGRPPISHTRGSAAAAAVPIFTVAAAAAAHQATAAAAAVT